MTLILTIAVLVGVAWGLAFLVRGGPLLGSLLYVVVGACLGHAFFHFDLGPLPLTLDRLVLGPLLLLYLVHRHLDKTAPKPLWRTDALLLAFLAVLTVSCATGLCQDSLTEPSVAVMRLIGGYLCPLAIYWIVRQTPLGRHQVSQVLATLTGLGVDLALTGILEITKQWWGVFPRHIADPQLGIHFGLSRGPMVHAVTYGLYTSVCMFAAWNYRWRFGRLGRLVLMGLMPLMLAGVAASCTRSVWIGTGLGLAVLLAFTVHAAWRPLVFGGLVLGGTLVALLGMETLMSFQREDSAADSRKSVEMRSVFAYVSWRMFLDRPMLGFGFGQFYDAKLPYLDDRSTDLHVESIRTYCHHNTFLSVLTETGLLGFVLYVGILIGWTHRAWMLIRTPGVPDWARSTGLVSLCALSVYVVQAMFHEMSYTPIDHSLIFLLAGVTAGLCPLAMHPGDMRVIFRNPSARPTDSGSDPGCQADRATADSVTS